MVVSAIKLSSLHARFDHPVSQVAAGIVLACYMEGICACKYRSNVISKI
jgi:hypothetical protein